MAFHSPSRQIPAQYLRLKYDPVFNILVILRYEICNVASLNKQHIGNLLPECQNFKLNKIL